MSEAEREPFCFVALPNGWIVGRFSALDAMDSVVHMVTTRKGPVVPADVKESGKAASQIADAMGMTDIAYCSQAHGTTVLSADTAGFVGTGDAMVTNVSLRGLMGRSADCPLILVADPVSGAVGLAHASWQGTVDRIASKLVVRIVGRFGARPQDLRACIGPSAGPCCYGVRRDVLQRAVVGIGPGAERFFPRRDGKMYFDLWSANVDELVRAGLPFENVHVAGVCTICRNDVFPSYRVEGASAARFAAVIATR